MTRILNLTFAAVFAALIGLAYWLPNLDTVTRLALAFTGVIGLAALYSYNIFRYLK